MSTHFVLLYVDSPAASAGFYTTLLDRLPVETSPTFTMFALAPGLMLGLWSRHTVEPAATGAGGGGELAFSRDTAEAVDATFEAWRGKGVVMLQTPRTMDFGHTFVALDPDGHRLRVFAPGEPPQD